VIKIKVQESDFSLDEEISLIKQQGLNIGGLTSFLGNVRDVNNELVAMTLEYYPKMTEYSLQKISEEAKSRWEILAITIIHRVGRLTKNDNIVLVIVASKHRKDAFQACEFIMDFLKTQAPFWKKEQTKTDEYWIQENKKDIEKLNTWSNK